MGIIEVRQPGLFSSIQDLGRFGMMRYGVPSSGVMDAYAAKIANLLVKNSESCAVMEITQLGPTLHFSEPTEIAISGAVLSPTLNGQPVENEHALQVAGGDVLRFGERQKGFRAYLALKGGIRTEKVLGSRSWCPGITKYQRLEKGMQLPYNRYQREASDGHAGVRTDDYLSLAEIEAFPGPEFNLLTLEEKQRLQAMEFSVGSQSNRMGIQLNEKLPNALPSILTGPVLPGTVQLPPSGQLIVLMKDAQTTGGYPRIVQLSPEGLNGLSQKVTGSRIRFRLQPLPDVKV